MKQEMLVAARSKTAKCTHCPLECPGGSQSYIHHNYSSSRQYGSGTKTEI